MSEKNPISILETDNFQKEIKRVALLNARELVKDGKLPEEDAEEFYITSGLKVIFRHLINNGIVRDRVGACFIEFSTLVSTLSEGMLDAFTVVYERTPSDLAFKKNVETYFKPIVKAFRENNIALLNHPDFMIEPHDMHVYISCLNNQEPFIDEKILKDNEMLRVSFAEAQKLFNDFLSKVKPDDDSHLHLTVHSDILKDLIVYLNSSAIPTVKYEEFIDENLLAEYRKITDKLPDTANKLLTIHLFNHLLYHHFFVPKESKTLQTLFVSLPIVASDAKLTKAAKENLRNKISNINNQPYKGLGAIFLFMTLRSDTEKFNEISFETIPFLIESIHNYCKTILPPVKDFIHGYGFETSKRLKEQIEMQATKAAISQVMARNMSHNIGSHVLSKFKNTDDVNQYLKSEIAEEISKIPGATSYPEIQINKQYQASKLQLNKNLKGSELVAYFNEYLKNRMDFLADIATTDPTMETSMYFLRDILSGLDRNRILLDRISGVSENIKFDFRVRRMVKGKWEEITGESKHDPLISVPNDILGCQALYIVIENIIRNIVKHSKHEHDLDFVINIDIEDYGKNPNYYKVFIYDNLFSKTKEEITELVASRNIAFNDTILEKDRGQLRTGNLGTIEMKVCAAYLRKYSLSSIENKLYEIKNSVFTRIDSNTETVSEDNQESDFNTDNRNIVTPHLMYAYAQQSEDQSKENLQSLGYTLFFRKPQTLLVIDDSDKLKISDEEKEDLRKDGIWILKQKDGGNHEYNPHTVYNHDFLLWMNEENYSDFVNKSYGSLPKRILSLNVLGKDFKIEKEKPQLAINQAWKLYGLHKFTDTPIAVTLLANEERTPTIFPQQKSKGSTLTNVAFDYHGEKWERNNEAFAYYDLVCSHHKVYNLKTYLFHNQAAENFQNILSQYAEMVLTKIMIIDERIQHSICGTFSDGASGKKYSKGGVPIPFTELFKKQNILIPDFTEANLNIPNFGKLSKEKGVLNSDADRIRKYIEDNKNACDFVVLHMGILEKVLPSGSDKSDGAINKLLLELGFNSIEDRKKIVITSGRGKPDNIPEDLCFVSLAILQNAIETLFDKYLLVKLLYSSRKTKDN